VFKANAKHPLFGDIQSLVRKYVGMDEIIERVINHLGEPKELYLIGDLATGLDSPDISLIIIGNTIDLDYLETLVAKAQRMVSRNIKYIVFTPEEFEQQKPRLNREKLLQVWSHTD
jgi:uncharacterized protein YejL (UPF0352 family)